MFVLTVDQVGSRSTADRVEPMLRSLHDARGPDIVLGPDRTAGDEFQLIVSGAAVALGIVLDLTRDGTWSVGLGLGAVQQPLPATTREASGAAFVAARDAVERAKRAPFRFALGGERTGDAEALIELLLGLRARRSAEGWAVADLLRDRTQAEAADVLGVSPQAVSARAAVAGLRAEDRAVPALARLLASADAAAVPA